MKRIIFLILTLVAATGAVGQNTPRRFNPGKGLGGFGGGLGGGLGSSASGQSFGNRDRSGNPIDTTAVRDPNSIPKGLKCWQLDPLLGDMRPVPVDTMMYLFQNSNDMSGLRGRYNHLGNIGLPRQSRVFFDRALPGNYLFTHQMDEYYVTPGTMIYSNTKCPFTNLTYYKEFDSRNGEERFKSYYAVNANKKLGFGFYTDYLYGRGHYMNQNTSAFLGGLYGYYAGDKYQMHMQVRNENMKAAENGGITDDGFITHPEDMAEGRRKFESYDIPVRLQEMWNRNIGYHTYLTHRYNTGFYKEKVDTVKVEGGAPSETDALQMTGSTPALAADSSSRDSLVIVREFVPVMGFIHSLDYNYIHRRHYSYDKSQNEQYFEHAYLGGDSIDKTGLHSLRNTFGIEIMEGCNKWVKAGLAGFISHELRHYSLPDSTKTPDGMRNRAQYRENTVSVGGRLSKQQGWPLKYDVTGQLWVGGEDAGAMSLDGRGSFQFKLLGDTARFEARAYAKRINPNFYYRHYHSKYYWWDDDLEKEFRSRIEATFSYPATETTLRAGIETIKDYTYLAATGSPLENGREGLRCKDDVAVRQADNVHIAAAILRQNLHVGPLHLDTEAIWQKSSDQEALPLPAVSLYGNLYLKTTMAKKVLKVELGADCRWFSKYEAPAYSPGMQQFVTQNAADRIALGGYPIVNVYANLHLKRTRIFAMMSHVTEGMGNRRSFLAPHYPINPMMFKLGLSWNFFD